MKKLTRSLATVMLMSLSACGPEDTEPLAPQETEGLEGALTCTYGEKVRTVSVARAADLQGKLNSAQPGDHLVLSGGTYSGSYAYGRNGTATRPIVIKAAPGASVVFTGTFTLGGSYGVLEGVKFQGGRVRMTGDHNRLTRSLFTGGSGPLVKMESEHSYNRVDHSEFKGFSGDAVEVSVGGNASAHPGSRIDHNYFFNHRRDSSEEVVRVLTDAFRDSKSVIEYNLFDKVLQGEGNQWEAISAKTSGMTIRGNAIVNSPKAKITLRESNRSLVEDNYLEGGGMNVFGDDHVIRGNKLVNGGSIVIGAGDGTMDTRECELNKPVPTIRNGGQCVGAHAASRDVKVYNNIGAITVGGAYDGDRIPAMRTQLWDNSGGVRFELHTGTQNRGGEAPPSKARRLVVGQDVGLNAPDASCR